MAQRLAIALDLARRFFVWWLAELTFLVPSRLRNRLTGGDAVALLLDAEQATVAHELGGKARVLGHVPAGYAPGAAAQIQKLLDQVPNLRRRVARGRVPVAVRLPAARALRTRLSLPLAVEGDLRQALAFQLDRRTPFPPDTVHFTHRVIARDDAAKQLDVELAVVPRTVVADALSAGQAMGLRPSIVEVEGAASDAPPSGNLLPDADRPRRRPAALVTRGIAAGLVVTALAALYQPIYAAQRRARDLQTKVEAAKTLALQGRSLKDEVAKLTEAEQFLLGGKKDTPGATEVLYELTRILPDDTWLEDFHFGTGEIRIQGYSKSASGLIKLLEQSGVFVNPQFRSAVTQDQANGKERFEITAKVAKKRSMS